MKRFFTLLLVFLAVSVGTQAKIKFGARGGYNVAKMSFDNNLFSSSNKNGFYVGPTLKIDLVLGFDIDASALYNQTSVSASLNEKRADASDTPVELTRKTFALPINLRKGFGFGDNLSVFVFAGPQFDFSLNKNFDIDDVTKWTWSDSMTSINVGVGGMFFQHLEVKVNYNIPCGKTGDFKWKDSSTYDEAYKSYQGKTGVWQIGAAIYF